MRSSRCASSQSQSLQSPFLAPPSCPLVDIGITSSYTYVTNASEASIHHGGLESLYRDARSPDPQSGELGSSTRLCDRALDSRYDRRRPRRAGRCALSRAPPARATSASERRVAPQRNGTRRQVLHAHRRWTTRAPRRDVALDRAHACRQSRPRRLDVGATMRRSFRVGNSKRDVADEIGFHLEMRTREFIERGMSPEDARRAAAASFGDVDAIAAECRDERAMRDSERARRDWVQGLGLDVRVALRGLWRRPAFTAASTLTLTLGIGAAAAVFAIVSGVLLRPLPYRDPARLIMVWLMGSDVHGVANQLPLSAPTYLDLAKNAPAIAPTAAFRSWTYTLSEGGTPEQVAGVKATPALFATLGVHPAIGRDFADADAVVGAPHVAIISDGLWRRRWAGDPSIVGKQITLSGQRFTVIGVAPRGFAFPRGAELPSGLQFPLRTDVWTPLVFTDFDLQSPFTLNLAAVARLGDGVASATASAQLARLATRLDQQYAQGKELVHFSAISVADQAAAPVRRTLLILLGAVGLVLLIACVNVANLLIARTGARRRELAVRTALGAGGTRLARQLVIENIVLTGLGAMGGVLLAVFASRLMLALVPGQLPRADDVAVDWRVVSIAAACALLAGIVFGAAAAAHARRGSVASALGTGSVRATSGAARAAGRRLLVGAQIALSLVLLVAAGM